MERVDLVLCGAEGVVENGGIVNLVVWSAAGWLFFVCLAEQWRE